MTTHRLVLLALVLGATRAAAQAPAQAPPAPRPEVAQAPALLRPPVAPPPPVAARPAPAAASTPTTREVVRPVSSGGALPPDSVRRATAVPVREPPANAVAQCGDGTFIVAPGTASACATHRGVRAVMPPRAAAPPTPVAALPTAALRAPVSATPPRGATMQCKDGTWLYGAPADGRCAGNGGLAAVLVPDRATPAPPSRPRRP